MVAKDGIRELFPVWTWQVCRRMWCRVSSQHLVTQMSYGGTKRKHVPKWWCGAHFWNWKKKCLEISEGPSGWILMGVNRSLGFCWLLKHPEPLRFHWWCQFLRCGFFLVDSKKWAVWQESGFCRLCTSVPFWNLFEKSVVVQLNDFFLHFRWIFGYPPEV